MVILEDPDPSEDGDAEEGAEKSADETDEGGEERDDLQSVMSGSR